MENLLKDMGKRIFDRRKQKPLPMLSVLQRQWSWVK